LKRKEVEGRGATLWKQIIKRGRYLCCVSCTRVILLTAIVVRL